VGGTSVAGTGGGDRGGNGGVSCGPIEPARV
jgi:hypothetical protein